jgi:hypothetical protein
MRTKKIVGKPEGKIQFGIPARKWDDIKMDLSLICIVGGGETASVV